MSDALFEALKLAKHNQIKEVWLEKVTGKLSLVLKLISLAIDLISSVYEFDSL